VSVARPLIARSALPSVKPGEQRSLFGEILDWMLAPLLLMWPLSLALTWLAAQGIAGRPYDRALVETVHVLSQRVQTRGERISFDLSRDSAQLLRADEVDSVYYQVRGSHGEFVAGERELPVPDGERPQAGEVRLRDEELYGDSVRIAYQWVMQQPDEAPVLLQVAETLNKRSRLATEIIKGVILPQFVILPISVLLVWLALARGLAPLHALQQRIRQRASDDLSPIDDRQVPEEVSPLVRAINDLLDRQHRSMLTQRRFLADASHQLKTPLAGLRMQAELAAREIDLAQSSPQGLDGQALKLSLAQMSLASQRAAHMVNQLLSMARTDAQGLAQAKAWLDLDALAREGYEGADFAAPLDVGAGGGPAQAPRSEALVFGHRVLLRELIANLVDNALHYTPAGGAVTLRVRREALDGQVLLQVEDSGPGIAVAERDLVFQAFYRSLGTTVDGSGLGLAIVAEIAAQHGAAVVLDDARDAAFAKPGEGPGARFTVRFPGMAGG
jgi:two-component system, OmpR family, sensor histidine kinase TctE